MRWTNYFLHPADNRYYVFTFREEEHAERFELSLKEDEIPFERNENEFSVPRTHFNEALRHNHLLHADVRKPFIENKGLREEVSYFGNLPVSNKASYYTKTRNLEFSDETIVGFNQL